MILLRIACFAGLVLLAAASAKAADALHPNATAHARMVQENGGADPYLGLANSRGQNCCGGRDCAPVAAHAVRRGTDGRLQVLFGGTWLPVDPANILPNDSPDGRMHACVVGESSYVDGGWRSVPTVRCLILPPAI